jgi:putative phage-type endonuclease
MILMGRFLGFYTPADTEWHEMRKGDSVTGTLVGTICGWNPWESAYTAWAKATGKISDERKQSLPMRLGQLLEPVVKQVWLEQNAGFIINEAGTWAHEVYDWARANPDGFLTYPDGSEGIIEIKTGRAFDEVPLNYRAQVLWYMFVTGLPKAKIVGLFFGSDLREWDIEFDEFEFDAIFGRVLEWRESVLNDVQPSWDGSTSTYETVRSLNPELDETEWVELSDLGVGLSNAQARLDEAEAELNRYKSATLDQMGSAKYGFVEVNGERLVVAQRSLRAGKPVLTVKKGK